jgi:hypothetical protein
MIERMSSRRRRTLHKLIVSLACFGSWVAMPPAKVYADEPEIENDSRLEGHGEKMVLGGGNATLTWLGFAFFSAIALLALFKDAKRSHLD